MRKRDRRIRNIPISKIVPNMITSGSVFCGITSLIMTYHQHFIPAAVLIFFAVFFDVMDGRVARSLGGSSVFGEEMDSLADAISFGVSPAFLMYAVYIGIEGGVWGAVAASFFALCGVLRLARFNVMHVPSGPFQGLPIPAGGLTLAAFVMARFPLTPLTAIVVMFFVGGLMVSSVPYCNAKKMKKDNVNKAKLYGTIGFILIAFVTLREKAFLVISLMYIFTGLFRVDVAEWILEDNPVEKKD
jgi:CDP-diacylglycerol--serine O-phosphatidyltransferase